MTYTQEQFDKLTIVTKEDKKFLLDGNNDVAVNTLTSGNVRLSGLGTALLVTTMNVTDTAIKVPSTPLDKRNTMQIYNKSEDDILYIGNDDVTADSIVGTTSGWEVDPGSYISFDIAGEIELYGVAPAGKTILIKVLEIS